MPDPHWICLQQSRSRLPLSELGLVLESVAIRHRVEFDGHQWCLLVGAEDVDAAQQQLRMYQQENPHRPPPAPTFTPVDSGWPGVLGYLAVIWTVPALQGRQTFGWDWLALGSLNAGAVLDGQWWRAVTALTLHADLGHIVANSLFGALFGVLAGRYLGSGVAWLLVLLAGAAGNLLNAALQPEVFRSIGASTATFAAVGIVGAFVWRRRLIPRGDGWRRAFAPVFAAIAMLAYTGVGGENTDIVGHFAGFGVGLLTGIVAAGLHVDRASALQQRLCGLAALVVVFSAWWLAGSGLPGAG
ncbi:MAG: rhomboid family intramembrane serine protease [Pseudomonadales bacterium]